jgi:hypothetical protein
MISKRLPDWLEPSAIRYWETIDSLGTVLVRVGAYGLVAVLLWFTVVLPFRADPLLALLCVAVVLLWDIFRHLRNPRKAQDDADLQDGLNGLLEGFARVDREREKHRLWISRLGYCRIDGCKWCKEGESY